MKRLFLVCLFSCLIARHSFAGSATWNLNPTTGDWNTAANWTPETIPNGSNDIATFGISNVTDVSVSVFTEVNGIVFDSGASTFTVSTTPFGSTLVFTGTGITNDSGAEQTFALLPTFNGPGVIQFGSSATAGKRTSFVSNGVASGAAPEIDFMNSSNAGSGRFTNNGALASGLPGCLILFSENSTATRATITNNGATEAGAEGGITRFIDTSSAGEATLTANGGSNGGDGGLIQFSDSADGGTARVELFGNGSLDITPHDAPGITIGSIEGNGEVLLGANTLIIGSNNLGTTFAGLLEDDGSGGSIVKIGKGSLSLSGASSYTGGTLLKNGGLRVGNTTGSATGTGPVQVSGGTLSGNGIIAGPVNVGTRQNRQTRLTPGNSAVGFLTIQNTLSFGLNGTYVWKVQVMPPKADEIVAAGVSIVSGALFSPVALSDATLPLGEDFIAISNTAATPISGTFGNLADGATVTVGSNKFQANYEGGDRNDLTLTVVQ